MTTERSHGKARTMLPRSADLPDIPTAHEPTVERLPDGKFGKGNALARGRGWKSAIRKQLGATDGADDVAQRVADDAWVVFLATIKELPHDGAIVRSLAMQMSRDAALAGFWGAEAAKAGLSSERGIQAQERAMKHGQRVERLTVTMLDVATRLAASNKRTVAEPVWTAAAEPAKVSER
jgi:hypothetical protein